MYMHINKTVIYGQAVDIYIFYTLGECHTIKFLHFICVYYEYWGVLCTTHTHAKLIADLNRPPRVPHISKTGTRVVSRDEG